MIRNFITIMTTAAFSGISIGNPCVYKTVLPVAHVAVASVCHGFGVVVSQKAGLDFLDCYGSETDYLNYMESECKAIHIGFFAESGAYVVSFRGVKMHVETKRGND